VIHAPTILLVDDHAPTREAYAAFLLDDGFDVLQAGHGGEAILLLSARRADLVVLDIAMPVLGGIDLADWMRRDFPGTAVPILAVTAVESRIQQERMRELCDDVLLKPCAPQVLAARIRTLLA
jgi:two-component system OmpR family response regulator